MNKTIILTLALLVLTTAGWSQFVIKNNTGDVLLNVDGNANVTIGSTQKTGNLTTDNIIINTGLTFSNGAQDRILRSNGSGEAAWGLENQMLSLNGYDLMITDGTGSGSSSELNSVILPPSWNWSFQNVEYEPIELDVSTTGSDYGIITFNVGVPGYTTGLFTMAGGEDPEGKDYIYLMKNNSNNWESWQCGGVSLDWDDTTVAAPVFENPPGSGNYDVYWAYRDQETHDNVNTVYLYIGLVGLSR